MIAGMGAGLLTRAARPWLPWLFFGVAGGVFAPVTTLVLLVMTIMASVIERARGAWVAYLIGVALVWVPLVISFRTGFPIWPYELVILCAAGLGLLVVGVGILRERLVWVRRRSRPA
jgi:hypothetical protein